MIRVLLAVFLLLGTSAAARPQVQEPTHPHSVNTLWNGSGPPSNTLGSDGDFYIDTTALVIYGPKLGGQWPGSGTALTGGNTPLVPNFTGIPKASSGVLALSPAGSADVIGLFGSITGNQVLASPNGTSGALAMRALVAADIPALSYQSALTFTGTGTKTASSTGSITTNDCAKWDGNGNVVDAGAGCGTTTLPTGAQNLVVATPNGSSGGSALRALVAGDIPSLSATYQTVLTFTGNGTKTASSTGSVTTNDCAKWDVNGNIVDNGAACGGVLPSGTAHQVLAAPSGGSGIASLRALVAGDIPALSYQGLLSFTGTGTKTASATGPGTSGDCANWTSVGNIGDFGAACFSLPTASPNKVYATNTSGSTSAVPTLRSLVAADIPSLSYQAPLTFTGSGSKTASSTGTYTTNDCAKWDSSGNVVDAGAGCGTTTLPSGAQNLVVATPNGSSGASGLRALVAADIPSLSATYQPLLTFTGNGANTASSTGAITTGDCAEWDSNGNIVDAGAACGGGSSLPTQSGNAGLYLQTDGTNATWGGITVGGSGALDCSTIPGTCDIVTAVVPFLASANKFTGANVLNGVTAVTLANAGTTGTTLYTLTKLTGAPSTAVQAATTDTTNIIGITVSGAGTTGSALVALSGSTNCVFDGATTAGHWVQISSIAAGSCHDTGSSTRPVSNQIIGRVLSTNASSGTYGIILEEDAH